MTGCYRGPITVAHCETVLYNEDGRYPSDHFPITPSCETRESEETGAAPGFRIFYHKREYKTGRTGKIVSAEFQRFGEHINYDLYDAYT